MKNPAFFRGNHRRSRYFEGWYFKCISADRKHALAFIPGMAVDPDGERHAFVQVIDAAQGKTWYFRYPYAAFQAEKDRFAVSIADNAFSAEGLSVNLSDDVTIQGQLAFSNSKPYPVSRLNPSIMGPFYFIPFMECYHAIIHLTHDIHVMIELDGQILDFTGGTGYIEKDYGRSFPRTYIWIQASHFDSTDASFVFSRARIPFMGSEFLGFFAYFCNFAGLSYRFATYNRAKLADWQVDQASGSCSGKLAGRSATLLFSAQMSGGGVLRAPIEGQMDREIVESIGAEVTVTLYDKQGNLLFAGTSRQAGMEISL